MLRIHTGLRNLSKTNLYDLHLKKMNSFDISETCINIGNSEALFEKYRMAINWDKYDIDILDDDAIKRNRIFFDFMQRTFSFMDGLYMDGNFLLIGTIKKYQLKKQSGEEVEILNRDRKEK